MAISQAQLESLYLAYFGRPADFDGLVFYTSNPNFDIWSVAAAFSASPESQALYGTGVAPNFISASTINAIYQNLFNRDAEPAGLTYWAGEVASGRLTAAGAAYGILLGAQNDDAIAVANKLAASAAFTAALDTAPEIIGYNGADAAEAARDWLATVTADPATLTAALAGVDAAVAAVVAVGGTIGASFTLTTTVDTITINDSTTINTINGVIDGTTTTNSTFSIGDTIDGNGKTILSLAIADGGTAAFSTVKDIARVDLVAGDSGSLNISAVNWSNIGAVNLNAGVDGLDVFIDQLNADVDLSVGTGVSGSISTSLTNDIYTWMYSDRGSSISWVDGDVTGTADTGGESMMYFWADTDDVVMTVGDVSITAAGNDGSDAYFAVYNTQDVGAGMTVGNVTMTGFTSSISLTIENSDHTASAAAANTTVGNVTLTGVGSASVEMYISNTSSGAAGNLTVGNIALTTGKSGSISATVENYGGKSVGALTVGSISIVEGKSANGSFELSQYAYASGTKAATAGAVTVGAVGFNIGQSASLDFSADYSAYASGSGSATIGNIAMGGVSGVLAQNASASVSIEVSAYSSAGAATIGNVALGDSSFTLAVDSSLDMTFSVTASSGGTKNSTVGDVTRGTLTVDAGINTTFSYTQYVEAYGGGTGSKLGNVTLGNFVADGDDGAYVNYYNYISSDGTAGNVDVGGVSMTLGVSATGYWDNTGSADGGVGNYTVGDVTAVSGVNSYFWGTVEFSASSGDMGDINIGNVSMTAAASATAGFSATLSASNDVGNVTVGDTTLVGTATSAYVYASFDFSAWNGDIGDVSVGDISLSAGKSATASYYWEMSGETSIGNTTVGNVTVSSVGTSAYAYASFTLENDSVGDIGTTTVGNVKSTVNGAGAYGGFNLSVSSADTIGTLTVGNLDLSIGNAASKTGAYLEVDIYNSDSAVVVGNISVTASGVRTVTDTTIAYDADVNISAATSVTVGTITVTGGDGKAEDFGTLANWLTLTGTSSGVTITGVDYSGYGAVATLDISTYKGNAFVKGGAKADTITDNKSANTLTGNGGADTFVFLTTNTGKTETTLDTVTDFNNAGGDKLSLSLTGGALTVVRYGEAVYTDFASFVTGSNAGNKAVFVGQIGGDSIAAVDYNEDGTVDYMVKLTGTDLSEVDVASFI